MCNASRKSAYRGDFDLCFFFMKMMKCQKNIMEFGTKSAKL